MTSRLKTIAVGAAAALSLIGVLQMAPAQGTQPFVVIVHPDNDVTGLTRGEISNVFLKETMQWSDGSVVEPVDLAGDSVVREAFSLEIHNRSGANVRSYWQREIFSGGQVPPLEIEGEDQVIEYVSQRPNAIGYVSASAGLVGVKAIGVIDPPVAVQRFPARYTGMARRFKVEGIVRLRLVVDAQGAVKDVEILEGLSHGLNGQAVEAVKRWKFNPGTMDGQPVEARTEVTVRFTL